MKIYFFSFGCKVNQTEIENLKSEAVLKGFEVTDAIESSNVVLINSCAVTDRAVKKFDQYISKIKRKYPYVRVVVTGCVADLKKSDLKKGQIDQVITNAGKASILSHLTDMTDCFNDIDELDSFEPVGKAGVADKTRAFLKIQDGCDALCSYCIIPSLRGKPRSRTVASVKAEFEELLSFGYKEVVLVGIHIGKYGMDTDSSLLLLLKELMMISGDYRVRLSSLEVMEVNDELIDLIAESGSKICPHFHIPMQSGSDTILARMNRNYSSQTYLDTVRNIQEKLPNAVIGADVIVGFPGETDELFNETVRTIEKSGLDYLHVFSFSEREGTLAVNMEGKVASAEIEKRAKKLRSEAESFKFNAGKRFFGKTVRVLIEKENKGLTDQYLSVKFLKDIERNTFVNAKIFGVQINGELAGEVIHE